MIALYLVLAVLAGIFTWSFLEYVIHRWLGHSKQPRTAFGVEHRAHHRTGDYFAPTAKKMLGAAPAVLIAFGVAWLLFGVEIGAAYALGFAGFYTLYEVVHRRIHTHPPVGPYTRFVRKHHLYHHFHSARMNHGVTSPIWDMVFGTLATTELVRVPEAKATRWMCDADGEVREAFQADYTIRRQRRKADGHLDETDVEQVEGLPA